MTSIWTGGQSFREFTRHRGTHHGTHHGNPVLSKSSAPRPSSNLHSVHWFAGMKPIGSDWALDNLLIQPLLLIHASTIVVLWRGILENKILHETVP